IPAIVEADPGEEVVLQTRDALDGQFNAKTTEADFANLNPGPIHPLTGPVLIKGAKPGDLLEIEFLHIRPESWAFTCILPGLGFLRDLYTAAFIVKWKIENNFASSDQLPGVRIPGASFMGVSGVAPSRDQVKAWAQRENEAMAKGHVVFPPDAGGAVPATG